MKKPLRFAIIGCGKIAPKHALEASRNGELVAVCDIIKERADSLAHTHGCRAYYSIDDLLAGEIGLDVIAICTPNGLHATHSIQSLKSGAHVICEKPLCLTSDEGRQMMEMATNSGRKLFVVKSTRYNPALVSLKKLIETGKLGTLYSFQLNCFWNREASYYKDSWKGSLDLDGGTLFTQFSHYIDAMIWLFGDMEALSGFRKNFAHVNTIEFEDSGVVALQMKNGLIGGLNWSINTFSRNMEVSLALIAEKGSIRIAGEYMNKLEYQLSEIDSLEVADPGYPNDYGSYKGSMSNHDKVYENLVRALEDDRHPFASAAEGFKTVETIERIYKFVPLQ